MTIELYTLFLLCLAAFCAGFVDAVAGGGGLIQLPVALLLLPAHPLPSVIASLKLPSFAGTAVAFLRFRKKVFINWKLAGIICSLSFFSSFAGSQLLTVVNSAFMKPVLCLVLFAVFVYTFIKKNFGQNEQHTISETRQIQFAVLISAIIGFYDGFIGPGAGSFFILAFVALLRYDLLHASATAKLANMATNLGSITLFLFHGNIIWLVALPMALANALGGAAGAKMAIQKGNKFIRIFFLFIVLATLLTLGYNIFAHL